MRRLLAILGLVVGTLALPAAVPAAHAAPVTEPHADPFYVPPAGYESAAPGAVLRTRPVTVTGLGIPLPVTATQALVRSTDAHDRPMAIVTTLLVPKLPTLAGLLGGLLGRPAPPRPLLSYQPAIDSLGDQCQPSYTLRSGTEKELIAMLPALLQGWAIVVTDYQGPRHAFGAGRLEGRATLDGVRAAQSLTPTSGQVGLWGYSGGALASGWAAQQAPTYAPELNIVGVAAGGTPADLEAAGRAFDGSLFVGLFLAAAVGVSREYPEFLDLMNDRGHALVAEYDDLCVTDEASRHAFARLAEFTTVPDPLSHPTVQAVLDENQLGVGAAPTAPVYLYHSVFDQLIPYATAQTLRQQWCAQGTRVQFVTDLASEHITYAFTGAPGALLYLMGRFAGQPAPSNCGR